MDRDEANAVDWDELEAAGHNFLMVAPLVQGLAPYVCENCATLMIIGQGGASIEIWHHPHREDRACEARRSTGKTLDKKLKGLLARQLARLEEV